MRGATKAVVTLALTAAAAGFGSPAVSAPAAQTPENYIVVLEPGPSSARAEAATLARQYGGSVGFVYEHALRGFSVTVSPAAADALARNPHVAYVEADQPVSIEAQATPTGINRIGAAGNSALDIDGTDDWRVDVDVAVIDTGIDLDNSDLNVAGSINCLNKSSGSCVAGGDDDHYHGTHVAGTIGALDNGSGVVGVAPGARLWAVKVLDRRGSGSDAGVIAGIDWVVARGGIEVANLSLGGTKSTPLNQAVASAVAAGVTVVVAAGNASADVANSSPASEPRAITVSALADFNGQPGGGASPTCSWDVDDTFADFSNYGTIVDIIAPGVCITSTNNNSTTLRTISGTSMASPHVAGAAALLRSTGRSQGATEVALTGNGNVDWSNGDDPDGVQEPLLDVSNASVFAPTMTATAATPPPAPPAQIQFAGSATRQKSTWTAKVHVSGASPNSTVAGTWSVGGSQNTCVTSATGTCTISRNKISKSVSTVTWTYSLDASQVVTIHRP